MTLPKETITRGASPVCDCGATLPFKVLHSMAGYYIGTFCDNCGPYSRQSNYFRTYEAAQVALDRGPWSAR